MKQTLEQFLEANELIESCSNDTGSWAVAGHRLTDTSLTDCPGGSEADTEASLRVELIHWEIGARAARPGWIPSTS
jgi:hypothetical protein